MQDHFPILKKKLEDEFKNKEEALQEEIRKLQSSAHGSNGPKIKEYKDKIVALELSKEQLQKNLNQTYLQNKREWRNLHDYNKQKIEELEKDNREMRNELDGKGIYNRNEIVRLK
jgi:hypothetical protein